jgi:hypothetical protein
MLAFLPKEIKKRLTDDFGRAIAQAGFFFCEAWHCGHYWPIVPASGDSEDDYGEAHGM